MNILKILRKYSLLSDSHGAAAPLIKQTYALFWFAIIITSLIFVYLQPKDKRFYQLKLVGKLFLAACVSAAIAWLVYCWSVVLPGMIPHS